MNTPTTGSGVPTVDGTSASCPGREHLECSGGSALCAGPTQDSRLYPLHYSIEREDVLTKNQEFPVIPFPFTCTPTKKR